MNIESLRSSFEYEHATGDLIWLCGKNNGKVAGCLKASGYRHVYFDGRLHQAHRLVWFYFHGEWPEKIDHINGVKSDNRIENLRSVSDAVNAKNRPIQRNNTSGHPGVSWRRNSTDWYAYIRHGGKMRGLGVFKDKADAIAARQAAEVEYGFHPNHGRAG